MKIVFDTNIYVSLALHPEKAGKLAFETTLLARWRVYVSDYLLGEFSRVMVHELGRSPREVDYIRRSIAGACTNVSLVPSRHVVPSDPDDTPILQTALVANADYLVTRDSHLLSLNPYERLRIVSLASYYRLLEDRGLL
jgi:putative PIN family toxin of toxin-antitoxin system